MHLSDLDPPNGYKISGEGDGGVVGFAKGGATVALTEKDGGTVNGKAVTADVDARTLLVQFLRENLRLTGTHVGCDTTPVRRLRRPYRRQGGQSLHHARAAGEGAKVTTIEGLAEPTAAASDAGGLPRAITACSAASARPGMIMTALDIVRRKGNELDEHTIREQLDGNICRCTGYHNIVKAIRRRRQGDGEERPRVKPPNRDVKTPTGGDRHERDRDRRGGAPQGRSPLHHRQGPIHRRRQPAGRDLRGFLRSPHAHAKIKASTRSAREKMPGVLAVLTGAELADDKIGNLICGWMIHSKDGTPMKMAPHPALAPARCATSATRSPSSSPRRWRRPRTPPRKSSRLRGAARGRPIRPRRKSARRKSTRRAEQHDLSMAPRRREGRRCRVRLRQARHQARHHQQPAGAERDRAARRDRRIRRRHRSLHALDTTQNPHVARLVIAAFVGMAPEHKLRVIAPDVGGGFGSKIFIYPEEVVCLWAARKVGRPVKWTADRSEAFLTDAHGRDHVTHAEMALDADGKILGLRVKTIANLGAYMSTFSSSVPTYLYATLLSGQYDIPAIYCEVDAVYTNTVPVDAYRGAGRPEATFVVERLVEVGGARDGRSTRRILRKKNFIKTFPHQTPVIMAYDAGDYQRLAQEGAGDLRLRQGFAKRKREARRRGKLRGLGFSTYIEACGIAPSPGGRLARLRRRPLGEREVRVNPTGSVEVLTGSHSARPGPRDHVRPAGRRRLGIPIDNVTIVHGDTDKVQFGMGTYGSRSGAVGMSAIVKALDKIEAKAKKVAAHLLEAAEGDIEFKDGKFTVAGTDKSAACGDVALNAYIAHKFAGRSSSRG